MRLRGGSGRDRREVHRGADLRCGSSVVGRCWDGTGVILGNAGLRDVPGVRILGRRRVGGFTALGRRRGAVKRTGRGRQLVREPGDLDHEGAPGRGESAGARIDLDRPLQVLRAREIGDRPALERQRHEALPDLRGVGPAVHPAEAADVDEGALGVGVTDPDRCGQLGGRADEPGVAVRL